MSDDNLGINPEGFGEKLTLWEYIDFKYGKTIKIMETNAFEGDGDNRYYIGVIDTLNDLRKRYGEMK